MILITESKRDDLLIPYYNLVKDVYPNLSLGEFKKMMLRKLAAQGSLNNLSLSSNYYLAGATKYYFQGALTTDGQKQIMTGDPNKPDNWNIDICKRLNACIKVLRNAYIDTVGTTFEQPEDFGELSLPKLLKKYGKKIDAELGETEAETKKDAPVVDTLDRNNRVGNGYTFDIIYNYPQATKYNQYTVPGAWCITYGQGHYDGYMQRDGIHYVIFRKDGFENVKRPKMPVNKLKPQDEYGNSLIAYLQYNNNYGASKITSRWNHGYNESSGTEADHAYNLQEFMQVTGVKVDDLQRILKIWHTDRKLYSDNIEDDDLKIKVDKKTVATILRKLKYLQMLLNGGETLERAAEIAGLVMDSNYTKVLCGNGDPKKSAMLYHYTVGDNYVEVLVDRNKVVFESMSIDGEKTINSAREEFGVEEGFDGLIFITKENKNMIYNCRYREFLSVNGTNVFKKIPKPSDVRRGNGEVLYFEVKNSMKDAVLVSAKSGRPLKLPNGDYWYNDLLWSNKYRWERGGMIHCHALTSNDGPVLEITYDESSGEKYFFDINNGRFMDWVNNLVNHEEASYYTAVRPEQYKPTLPERGLYGFKDLFTLVFTSNSESRYSGYQTEPEIYNINGHKFSIYGRTKFNDISGCGKRIIVYEDPTYKKPNHFSNDRYNYYDHVAKKCIAAGTQIIAGVSIYGASRWSDVDEGDRYFYIELVKKGAGDKGVYAIYDKEQGMLLMNNTELGRKKGYKYQFQCVQTGEQEKVALWLDDWERWKFYSALGNMSDVERMRLYGKTDSWDIANIEEKKHYKEYDLESFERIPNDLPINNEFEAGPATQPTAAQPAVALTESDIHNLVIEAIKKIVNQ